MSKRHKSQGETLHKSDEPSMKPLTNDEAPEHEALRKTAPKDVPDEQAVSWSPNDSQDQDRAEQRGR